MDKLLKGFRENFVSLMRDDAALFKEDRLQHFYRDPLSVVLINDEMKAIRRLKFDTDERIDTMIIDLTQITEGSYGTESMLQIKLAASQGSQVCFLYLIRRMPDFSIRDDSESAKCCCAGQNKFILGFITGLSQEQRVEMFRMAAKWKNMYIMILLLHGNLDVNCKDEYGYSDLHFATRNGNVYIV